MKIHGAITVEWEQQGPDGVATLTGTGYLLDGVLLPTRSVLCSSLRLRSELSRLFMEMTEHAWCALDDSGL